MLSPPWPLDSLPLPPSLSLRCLVQMFVQCVWEYLSAKGRMLYAPRMDDPQRHVITDGVGVDNASFAKFTKDMPGFLRTKSFMRHVDLIHARHKTTGQRGLTREQLGNALVDLAVERFGKVRAYRRCRGQQAQLMMLVNEFMLHVRARVQCTPWGSPCPASPQPAYFLVVVGLRVDAGSTAAWATSRSRYTRG